MPATRHLKWQGGPLPGLRALEVGAEAMAVVEAIALRIEACGGFALLIDYGKDGPYESSLNAIRNHTAVHPLQVSALL
jgi:SAM-dependent MidA family methyltransferase